MVTSVLTRKTRLSERAQWEAALQKVLPRIQEVLREQPGFVSVQYAWDIDAEGMFAQMTVWQTAEDCRRYIREGAAATIATIEEGAIPTAAHPDGAWVRRNLESLT